MWPARPSGTCTPHVRREVAAGARDERPGERHRNAQRPHGIRLRLLLPGHREHAPFLPDGTRLAATIAVEPPTEPAVCTRIIGLPTAPARRRCTARHHDALEHVGRLADDDRVDVGQRRHRSSSALSMASRTRPAIETSLRLATYSSARCRHRGQLARPSVVPLQDGDQILLQAGPLVAWASTRLAAPSRCAGRDPDALQARRDHRVGRQRPPDGLIFVDPLARAPR